MSDTAQENVAQDYTPSKQRQILVNFFLVFLGIFAISITSFILLRIEANGQSLILLALVPIVGGIVFENLRLSGNWKETLLKLCVAVIGSSLLVHLLKGENYDRAISHWPYFLIITYGFISMVYHGTKTVVVATKGSTLLLSISIWYWLITKPKNESTFFTTLMVVAAIVTILSFLYALSLVKLGNKSKLWLSLWCSLVTVILAIDNLVDVVSLQSYLDTRFLAILINAVLYFIIGTSLIYTLKNLQMLAGFFKRLDTSGKEEIKKLKKAHIQRFSSVSITTKQAFIAVVILGVFYSLNYYLDILPTTTAIWIVLIFSPILLNRLDHK